MGKRVDVAERLRELGFDPVEGMVRIAKLAENKGNLSLAGKLMGDLLEYTAPKLKSMEIAIEPDTLSYLDRQQRLERIRLLTEQLRPVIDGSCTEVPQQLLHIPDEP